MNRGQFAKFLSDCDNALSGDYELKYSFIRNIASSKDEPLYRFSLTIVSKLNDVTCDFCHITIKDDSAIELVAQAIAYLRSSNEVPNRVQDVVNVYFAGFICAGGLL